MEKHCSLGSLQLWRIVTTDGVKHDACITVVLRTLPSNSFMKKKFSHKEVIWMALDMDAYEIFPRSCWM